jgi:predicted GNAT superfamily acetyltransferase
MGEGSASVRAAKIQIRAPQDLREMRLGVELHKQVWGYNEIDTVPDQMFIVARESGGAVLFAFDQTKPIGFALAFAGIQDGTIYLHSHMVGVLAGYQNQGIGRQLKLAQREAAIERGINLIEWTFDPLQLRNAHFNLVRLGAVVRRYIANFYGRTSSPCTRICQPTGWWRNGGSTRLEWRTSSGKRHVPASDEVRVGLPSTTREICSSDAQEAEKIQIRARQEFEEHFALGRAVVGFEFAAQHSSYVLEPYED